MKRPSTRRDARELALKSNAVEKSDRAEFGHALALSKPVLAGEQVKTLQGSALADVCKPYLRALRCGK